MDSSDVATSLVRGGLFSRDVMNVFPGSRGLACCLLTFFGSPAYGGLVEAVGPSTGGPTGCVGGVPFVVPRGSILRLVARGAGEVISRMETAKDCSRDMRTRLGRLVRDVCGVWGAVRYG